MSVDFSLLILLLNNISIFVVLIVGYAFLSDWLRPREALSRQAVLGLFFGVVVIISMHVKIPAADGVVIDQRNAIIVLSAAFGGPVTGLVTAAMAAAFRVHLGGIGTLAGITGVMLSTLIGMAVHHLGWHRRGPGALLVVAAIAVVFSAPGFLLVGDLENGWALLKRMAVPWGTGIFIGVFIGGLLLQREDRRQLAEREKRISEERYRTLFDSSEVSVWTEDFSAVHAALQSLRGRGVTDLADHLARHPHLLEELETKTSVTLANPAALRLYRVGSTAELAAHLRRIRTTTASTAFTEQLLAMWRGEPGFRSEETHPTSDGEDRTVILSMPIPKTAEEFASIPISALDISDRKRAERTRDEALAQANRANQAKSDFLAAMSHELRTPLNAILGFSEILTLEAFGPLGNPRYCEYARHVHTSGGLLLELVNDILDVSTIEAGRRDLTFVPVEMKDLIDEAVVVVSHRLNDKGTALHTVLPEVPTSIHVDKRAVQQILINLLTNSVKFTPEGGTITITARADSRTAEITVEDTGIGIPADRIDAVTNSFVRGETDPHKAQGGWGLGLSIAKSLAEMHGGALLIDSVVNKGTRVTVRLPRHPDSRAHGRTEISLVSG
jgi:signal transduction histidine kinase